MLGECLSPGISNASSPSELSSPTSTVNTEATESPEPPQRPARREPFQQQLHQLPLSLSLPHHHHQHQHHQQYPQNQYPQKQYSPKQYTPPARAIVPPPPQPAACGSSNVDCYTCRRRRVKCDRQLPLCAKCERTKLECLGYKKPLVWNKGVASRGKMMGKTFPTPSPSIEDATSPTTLALRRKQQKNPPPLPEIPRNNPQLAIKQEPEEDSAVTIANCNNNNNELIPSGRVIVGLPVIGSLPGELTLNLQMSGQGSPFAHLPSEARFYMDYFERRVTCDLVLFDRGSNNPYRHLMPAAVHHPALLNGILAVAARHHSNLCGTPVSKHLPYKGASFGYLSRDLQRLDSKAILTESTLAVVMLFLFFETLDGGLNTWKIHLSGARRLIQMCLSLESLPAETLAMLRIFMNHVALVDIIGRTLAFGSTSSDPGVFDTNVPEFLTFLRDGEQYNFLGCPAPLLETIHAITQLKHSPLDQSPENYIGTCQALLANIDTFSADAYVVSRVDINDAKDSSSLHRLVCAYKCAARIYAVETLFSTVATSDTTEPYHAELRMHISSLESGSLFMKGAVWPVFIAGTGARGLDERCWVREQLKRLWEVLPQGNIKNAGKVLEDIWMKVDEQGGMVHGWRILEEGASDWLFV